VVAQTSRCNVAAVTEAHKGTQADSALRAALGERGVTVTDTQLKRWRHAGLLPSPIRVAAGRGQGRRSTHYPPGTVDLAAAVAKVVIDDRVSLRHAPAVLFARGFAVAEKTLKVSYATILGELAAVVDRVDGDPRDAVDKVAQQARRRAKRSLLGRTLISRDGTYGGRQNSQLDDALAAGYAAVFTGVEPSADAAKAINRIYGSPQSEENDPFRAAAVISVARLQDTLHHSTFDSLVTARQIFGETLDLFARVHSAQDQAGQLHLAPGIEDPSIMDDVTKATAVLLMASTIEHDPTYVQQHQQQMKSAETLP